MSLSCIPRSAHREFWAEVAMSLFGAETSLFGTYKIGFEVAPRTPLSNLESRPVRTTAVT